MKKRWTLGAVLGLAIPLIALTTSVRGQDKKPEYIGANSCAKICHKTAKQGKQLSLWQASQHAQAFQQLKSDKAKEFSKTDDPTQDDTCLKCHSTAGGSDAAVGSKYSHEDGVGCESCHGPGSLYKKRSTMKDREKSLAAGLLVPNAETCTKCHNQAEGNPHEQKAFDYEARSKEIAHPKPKAE